MNLFLLAKKFIYTALFCLVMIGSAQADNAIIISSVEWPPYTGANLPGNGESAIAVREAFSAMGYKVVFRFLPWKRAMLSTKTNPLVVGYFPAYFSKSREKEFIYSKSIGCSPVEVLTRKKDPIVWDKLDDLVKYKLGLVSGYVNTTSFDNWVAEGKMNIDYGPDDKTNIKKLIRARIHGAVIDRNVYNYISTASENLAKHRKDLAFSGKLLGTNKLYVCFARDSEGARFARIFNEGLKRIGEDHSNDVCK
ncbi:MAG: hypothetical protein BA863_04180 [Desulfovibrio sp. S3730MH75]|nr:MAG: hypothetical protein BA863_04180 [Desulfovibrio sp. S3730MH75]